MFILRASISIKNCSNCNTGTNAKEGELDPLGFDLTPEKIFI